MSLHDFDESERDRLRDLSDTNPDQMTIDDIENLAASSSDEYWTEVALSIAIKRLRDVTAAAADFAKIVVEQSRSIAVAEAERKRYFGK